MQSRDILLVSQRVVVRKKVITDAKCVQNNYLTQVVNASFFDDLRGFLEHISSFSLSLYSYVLCCYYYFFQSTSYFCSFSLNSESISFVSHIPCPAVISSYSLQQINAENCCPVIRNGMVILIEVFFDTQTQIA